MKSSRCYGLLLQGFSRSAEDVFSYRASSHEQSVHDTPQEKSTVNDRAGGSG